MTTPGTTRPRAIRSSRGGAPRRSAHCCWPWPRVVVAAVGLAGDVGRVSSCRCCCWWRWRRRGSPPPARARSASRPSLVAVAALVVVAVVVLTAEGQGLGLVIVVALLAGSTALSRYALRRDANALKALDVPGTPVGPARQGVLIMNLKSGGGKAEQFGLVDECRQRGIEPVVLQPGDDLLELAQDGDRPWRRRHRHGRR